LGEISFEKENFMLYKFGDCERKNRFSYRWAGCRLKEMANLGFGVRGLVRTCNGGRVKGFSISSQSSP
jgi:hypothetical protein